MMGVISINDIHGMGPEVDSEESSVQFMIHVLKFSILNQINSRDEKIFIISSRRNADLISKMKVKHGTLQKCLEMTYFVSLCKQHELLCYLCGGGDT